jgi:hypothetical protein
MPLMRVNASPINAPPHASRRSNRPMPSQLRTNPVIHERKDTASVQHKKIQAIDKASKEDMLRSFDLIEKSVQFRNQ